MNRTDLLNFLADKYNLKRYLEIGVQNTSQNFDKIKCEEKTGVDPSCLRRTYGNTIDGHISNIIDVTSDDFFKDAFSNNVGQPLFSLVFLDGEHSEHQLEKDFFNALKITHHGAFICMHDTNPASEGLTHFPRDKKGPWNGSAYKFAARLKSKNYVTVDIDHGVSIYRKSTEPLIKSNSEMTWDHFDTNRKQLLNLVSWDEFIASHSHV